MLKRLNPRTNFDCDAMELAKLMFSADDNKSARDLGVTVDEWMQWKTGAEPVPKAIWLCLKQQKQLEELKPLQGFSLTGNRLDSPWGPMLTDEILRLPEYRKAARLAEKQADLIERLMMERDFYRDNLDRQARFGLMVNNIFKGDG
ncbi:hypothetical protein [Aquitalea aquatica]|uniref:Phage protein n=1 Tax=Aquitalea aquatica TaxID=3044273 RepID=A0A838YDC2_9NEIS|nr:hypothetical protein [Aquitalea magnusonii]MBA4710477.1 hypothetical protein [Aquitalea magnusonii]